MIITSDSFINSLTFEKKNTEITVDSKKCYGNIIFTMQNMS